MLLEFLSWCSSCLCGFNPWSVSQTFQDIALSLHDLISHLPEYTCVGGQFCYYFVIHCEIHVRSGCAFVERSSRFHHHVPKRRWPLPVLHCHSSRWRAWGLPARTPGAPSPNFLHWQSHMLHTCFELLSFVSDFLTTCTCATGGKTKHVVETVAYQTSMSILKLLDKVDSVLSGLSRLQFYSMNCPCPCLHGPSHAVQFQYIITTFIQQLLSLGMIQI